MVKQLMADGFEPGTLAQKVIERSQQAIGSGALLSLPTEFEFVEQQGVRFLVRLLLNLVRKDEAKRRSTDKPFNPFLPYDEALFVADISETHLCLLNKYNVVDHHILIVTRAFEDQEDWLNVQDFAAMWTCLAEFDGLAFYNGGKDAGASQPHKHLQLVPYLISPQQPEIPIESLITQSLPELANSQEPIATISELPFVHAVTPIDPAWLHSPIEAAAKTLERYHALLQAVSLPVQDQKQSGSYNLLVTRRWMLLIPRSQESFASIQVNSLGFAGALLVRTAEQMQQLKTMQPLTLLSQVGIPLEIGL